MADRTMIEGVDYQNKLCLQRPHQWTQLRRIEQWSTIGRLTKHVRMWVGDGIELLK